MNEKERVRELADFFFNQLNITNTENIEIDLNGWEGLIVWGPDGIFYQMNYKAANNWNITMFPYDIYGRKTFDVEEHIWKDKEYK